MRKTKLLVEVVLAGAPITGTGANTKNGSLVAASACSSYMVMAYVVMAYVVMAYAEPLFVVVLTLFYGACTWAEDFAHLK